MIEPQLPAGQDPKPRQKPPPEFMARFGRLIKARADALSRPLMDDRGRLLRPAIEDPEQAVLTAIEDLGKFAKEKGGPEKLRTFFNYRSTGLGLGGAPKDTPAGGLGMPRLDTQTGDDAPMPEDWVPKTNVVKSEETLAWEATATKFREAHPVIAGLHDVHGALSEIGPAAGQVVVDTLSGLANLVPGVDIKAADIKGIVDRHQRSMFPPAVRPAMEEMQRAMESTGGFGAEMGREAGKFIGTAAGMFAGGGPGAAAKAAPAVTGLGKAANVGKALLTAPSAVMRAGAAPGGAIGRALFKKAGAEAQEIGEAYGRAAGGFGAFEATVARGEKETPFGKVDTKPTWLDRAEALGIGAGTGLFIHKSQEWAKSAFRGIMRPSLKALGKDEQAVVSALTKWGEQNKIFPPEHMAPEVFFRRLSNAYIDAGMPGLPKISVRRLMAHAAQGGIEGLGWSMLDQQFREGLLDDVLHGNVDGLMERLPKFLGKSLGAAALHIPLADIPLLQRRRQVRPMGQEPKPKEPEPAPPTPIEPAPPGTLLLPEVAVGAEQKLNREQLQRWEEIEAGQRKEGDIGGTMERQFEQIHERMLAEMRAQRAARREEAEAKLAEAAGGDQYRAALDDSLVRLGWRPELPPAPPGTPLLAERAEGAEQKANRERLQRWEEAEAGQRTVGETAAPEAEILKAADERAARERSEPQEPVAGEPAAPMSPHQPHIGKVMLEGTPFGYEARGDTARPNEALREQLSLPEEMPLQDLQVLLEKTGLLNALQSKLLVGTEISAGHGIVKAVPGKGDEPGVMRTIRGGELLEADLSHDPNWKKAESTPARGKDDIDRGQRQAVELLTDALNGRDDLARDDQVMLSNVITVLDAVSQRNDVSVGEALEHLPAVLEVLNSGSPKQAGQAIKVLAEMVTTKAPEIAMEGLARSIEAEVAQAEGVYKIAQENLKALGQEPPKPSSEKKRFGSKGKEGAKPEDVEKYEAEVKAYESYRRKYLKLKKREVDAGNELFRLTREKPKEALPEQPAPESVEFYKRDDGTEVVQIQTGPRSFKVMTREQYEKERVERVEKESGLQRIAKMTEAEYIAEETRGDPKLRAPEEVQRDLDELARLDAENKKAVKADIEKSGWPNSGLPASAFETHYQALTASWKRQDQRAELLAEMQQIEQAAGRLARLPGIYRGIVHQAKIDAERRAQEGGFVEIPTIDEVARIAARGADAVEAAIARIGEMLRGKELTKEQRERAGAALASLYERSERRPDQAFGGTPLPPEAVEIAKTGAKAGGQIIGELWNRFSRSLAQKVEDLGAPDVANLGRESAAESRNIASKYFEPTLYKMRRWARSKLDSLNDRVEDRFGGATTKYGAERDEALGDHFGRPEGMTAEQREVYDAAHQVVRGGAQAAEALGVTFKNRGKDEPVHITDDPQRRRLPRLWTDEGAEAIRARRGPIWEALVKWHEQAEGKTPEQVNQQYTNARGVMRFDPTEFLRRVRLLPTQLRVGSRWVRILEDRPLEHSERLARETSAVMGARSVMPRDLASMPDPPEMIDMNRPELPLPAQQLLNKIKTEKGDEVADAAADLLAVMHGMAPKLSKPWFPPGSPAYHAVKVIGGLTNILKAGHLTTAFVRNIPEALGNMAHLGAGNVADAYRQVAQSFFNGSIRDRHRELVEEGWLADSKENLPLVGENKIETFENLLKKAGDLLTAPLRISQNFNELVIAQAAKNRLAAMREKNGGKEDFSMLKLLGFTPAEAAEMIHGRGTKEQYDRYRTGVVGNLAGGRSQASVDKSMAGHSRGFNALVWFSNFFQTRARLVDSLWRDVKESTGRDKSLAIGKMLAVAGLTGGAGALGNLLAAGLFGGEDGMADYLREGFTGATDEEAAGNIGASVVQLLSSGLLGGLGTPITNAFTGTGSDKEKLANTALRMIGPLGAGWDFAQMVRATAGEDIPGYENMSRLEKFGKYLRNNMPAARAVHEGLFGLGALAITDKDPELDAAQDAAWRWKHAHDKAGGEDERRAEDREWKDAMRNVIDKVNAGYRYGDDELVEALVDAQIAHVARDEAAGNFDPDRRRNARTEVAKSLMSRRMLPDPKSRQWTEEQRESFYHALGEKHLETLRDFDRTLEVLADRMRPPPKIQ